MTNNSFFKKRQLFPRRGYALGIWIMVLTVSFFLLSNCNSNTNNQHKEAENNVNHETKVQLNDGAKWKADSSTNANVSVLQNIVAQNLSPDINEYHQRGKQLQEGIDIMIKECRMSGPDHEALHHWLEPLIEDVRRLQQAQSVEQALEINGSIKTRLAHYRELFE